MIISYKLSGKSIGALKKKGLSDKAVTELRLMEAVSYTHLTLPTTPYV